MQRYTGVRREDTAEAVNDLARSYALPIIAVGVIIAILYWARLFFIVSFVAVILALILEPFVGLLVRLRFPRPMATLVVCVVAVAVLYLAGIGAWSQLAGIAADVPVLKENTARAIEDVTSRVQRIEDAATRLLTPSRKQEPPPPPQPQPKSARNTKKGVAQVAAAQPLKPDAIPEVRIHDDRTPVEDYIVEHLDKLYQVALMSSFIPLLVYFMLSWRDHIYKSFLRFFDGSSRQMVSQSLQGIAEIARAFVVGNFIIGVMLAAVSTGSFAVIRLPYPFLIGSLSGFLSLVPYAGLVLAFVPPVIAAFATGTSSSVLLLALVVVAALHLIAMNVLYPTIVGARVHLNPLVVTFSLMFWGFMWDAAGLVLAIPITAGIKAVCDHVHGLRKYGRFLGD